MIIGLVFAMENELRPFLMTFSIQKTCVICHNTFYISKNAEKTIIAVCSGRGKVNATIFTQVLLNHFSPDIVINLGVSGRILANSKIHDLYIGTSYCHYDVRIKQSKHTFPNQLYYHGDFKLIELMTQTNPAMKKGIFGTGEGFVTDKKQKDVLISTFNIVAVDMESAAIAQCCYLNDTPYLSCRGICDTANEEAVATTEELQETISSRLVEIFSKMVESLA